MPTRRRFLQTAGLGSALFGLGDLSFLSNLPRVSADEAKLSPELVRFSPEIEPLVRLLEEAPRESLIEKVAARIHEGTTYQEVLAALLLAGVRNIQPRPSVGFKFHAVLVVNSAHLASLGSPDEDRWLPIFWAIDHFKDSQADEARQSGWRMPPVEESRVPAPHKARQAFIEAMESWDAEAADAAVAGLVRTAGTNELFELFCRYGGRDYRSIGHKAIFVANSWRTLNCIGWQYAEPVLRSLAHALVNHTGDSNPAKSNHVADQPWRRNQELMGKLPENWQSGKVSSSATQQLLSTLHSGTSDEACDQAVELLKAGVSPRSVWDAILVGSGELLARQPGIIGLHSLTTANAFRYAYDTSGDDDTRKLLLLQCCAFLPMFRGSAAGRGNIQDWKVTQLEAAGTEDAGADEALKEIFADVSGKKMQAASKVLGYLDAGQSAEALIDAARRLTFLKGSNAHDYKFSSAVLEDFGHVTAEWRNRYMATCVFNLRGSGDRDNRLIQRTRSAFEGTT